MTDAKAEERGEKQCWVRRLVAEHQTPLIRYARSIVRDEHVAKDVVQETFMQLCKQLPLDLDGHEAAWLFRVCHNSALNRLRKEQRMTHSTDSIPEMEFQCDPSEPVSAAEQNASVLRMIDTLPENQQKVIRLRFHSGLAYKEISEATGLSQSNVGFLLHTALGRLRELADATQ